MFIHEALLKEEVRKIRLLNNERGSISSFLMLVFPVLVVLFALLADLVRVHMTTSEAESTARRLSRSVLSAFEPALLQCGLFGTGGHTERWNEIMGTVKQLEGARTWSGRFAFYDASLHVENAVLEPVYPLADHRVFRRQILERMKYIAGIEFGIEVAQQFSRGKQQIVAAEQYAKLSETLERLVRKRELELDEIWELSERLANSARSVSVRHSLQPQAEAILLRLNGAEQTNADIAQELNGPASVGEVPAEMKAPPVVVHPPSYFSGYKTSVATIGSMHSAWLKTSAEAEVDGNEPRASEAKEQLDKYVSSWLSEKSKEELRRRQDNEAAARSRADRKQAAEQELKERRNERKDACRPADAGSYAELEGKGGLFEKYRSYNEHMPSGGMSPLSGMQEAEPLLFASLELARTVTDIAESVRDEVLINEYALTHFTYRTYETDKAMRGSDMQTGIGDREAHRLKGQEAEYILYGFPDCMLNLGAMHAELFVLRTGLRTVESLLKPKAAAAASPMLALLGALAEGAKAANEDVNALLAGRTTDLPFVPGVAMDYKDHLRLFYLLHSNDDSTLSRMQSLVQLNTGINLTQYFSSVRMRMDSVPRGWLLRPNPVSVDIVTSY